MYQIMQQKMSLSVDGNKCVTPEPTLRCNSPDLSPVSLQTCAPFQKTKSDGNKYKRKTIKMTRKQKRSMRVSLHSVNERQRHSTVNQAIQYLKTTLPSKEPTLQDTKFMVLNRAVEYVDFLRRKVQDLGRQRGKTVYLKDGYLCIEVQQKGAPGLGSKPCVTGRQADIITPEILEELIKNMDDDDGDDDDDDDEEEDENDAAHELRKSCGKSVKAIQSIEYPCTPKRDFSVVPSNTPDTSLQTPWIDNRFALNSATLSPSRGDQLLPSSLSLPYTGTSLSPIFGSSQSTANTPDSDPFVSPEFSPVTDNNFPCEHSYSRKVLSHDRDIMELEDSIAMSGIGYSPPHAYTTQVATHEQKETDGRLDDVSESMRAKFMEESHVNPGNHIQQQRKASKKLQKTDCDPFESCHRLPPNFKSSNCEMCMSPGPKSNEDSAETSVTLSPPPPKSWINGYQLYTRLNYQIYKMKNPDLVGREVTKALGNAWRELLEEDRKQYSQQACDLNEQRRLEREAIIMTQQKSRDMKTS